MKEQKNNVSRSMQSMERSGGMHASARDPERMQADAGSARKPGMHEKKDYSAYA